MALTRARLAVVLALVFTAPACRKEEKRPVRTEPWPAPALSVSVAMTPGATIKYVLERGSVQIELKGKRSRFNATIERLQGELDFDPARLEKTRGSIRADLLSLSFTPPSGASTDASELTLVALRALELTAERPPEDRERDRWAIVRVTGFRARENEEGTATPKQKAPATAFAELTLHRFRVPMTLELDVEVVPMPDAGAPELRARTRRPIVVQLAAHDLDVSSPRSSEAARGSDRAREGVREARVSAELSWRPTGTQTSRTNNP